MSWILVAHSSALCHPADICYICMAAGDPWIKRLQEYCHISFNNIIILWGKRCFIPDALQSLVCSFHLLSPFLPLVSLCPSSLSSSLFSSQPFFLQAVSLLMLVTCCLGQSCCTGRNVCADECRSHYLPDKSFTSFFFFSLPATPRLSGPQKLNQHFAKVSETTTATKKEWATSKHELQGMSEL